MLSFWTVDCGHRRAVVELKSLAGTAAAGHDKHPSSEPPLVSYQVLFRYQVKRPGNFELFSRKPAARSVICRLTNVMRKVKLEIRRARPTER